MKKQKPSLTIGWLYPDLMSTYGDRGNVIVLQKRCEWRGIDAKVKRITVDSNHKLIVNCDLLFMGGAQDTQQEIVNRDLFKRKGRTLSQMINQGIPGLFICGAYQFLGKYYKTADGTELPGLALFPVYTENPGENVERLIGNIIIEPLNHQSSIINNQSYVVGFENHGGRTYLDHTDMTFARVIKGYGNNGEDETEGLLYKNAIGTYLHGPILPKNPEIADFLISKALETKYGKSVELKPLDDSLAIKAKDIILQRLKV